MAEEIITETNRETAHRSRLRRPPRSRSWKAWKRVRKRPGMYIGSTGPSGLHHLGLRDRGQLHRRGPGRLLHPHRSHHQARQHHPGCRTTAAASPWTSSPSWASRPSPSSTPCCTPAGKFGGRGFRLQGGRRSARRGCFGGQRSVGMAHRAGPPRRRREYEQSFKRGKPDGDLKKIGTAGLHRGPWSSSSRTPRCSRKPPSTATKRCSKRLREEAFLNARLCASPSPMSAPASDRPAEEQGPENDGRSETMCYEGGIPLLCELPLRAPRPDAADPPGHVYEGGGPGPPWRKWPLQYYDNSYNELLLSFANNVHTPEGGTHEEGFKLALTRVLNEYARAKGILKDKDENLSGSDAREGIIAVGQREAAGGPSSRARPRRNWATPSSRAWSATWLYKALTGVL